MVNARVDITPDACEVGLLALVFFITGIYPTLPRQEYFVVYICIDVSMFIRSVVHNGASLWAHPPCDLMHSA